MNLFTDLSLFFGSIIMKNNHELLKFRSLTRNLVNLMAFSPGVVIREVRVAGNMNSTEKFRKRNVRDILFYPSLPHVLNCDIFIIPPNFHEPHVINGVPLTDENFPTKFTGGTCSPPTRIAYVCVRFALASPKRAIDSLF